MISLKEIGRICGLAESTVSKALKNNPRINAETRERVREIAKRYNYQPNAMVECIQRGRSRTIGIAYNNFRDGFAGSALHGALEKLDAAGYETMVVCWDMIVARGAQLLSRFSRRRVDAMLLFPMAKLPTPDYVKELRSLGVPVAVVDQTWPGNEFHFIGSDNFGGAVAATRHLTEGGAKRLGCLRHSGVSSGVERWEGFLAEMRRQGLPVLEELCPDVNGSPDWGREKARALLTRKDRPDGIFCFNDYCAFNVLKEARDLGVAMPEDLAVAGFGNLPWLRDMSSPLLTTVDQFPEEIGRKAAEVLLKALEKSDGASSPQELRIPTKLLQGESTKTPPRRAGGGGR